MATENQIAANRRNAQHSTGPRSVEGKARSSRNALKTGLYCPGIIIGKESPVQLIQLEAAYTAEYAPATPTERALVDSTTSGSSAATAGSKPKSGVPPWTA